MEFLFKCPLLCISTSSACCLLLFSIFHVFLLFPSQAEKKKKKMQNIRKNNTKSGLLVWKRQKNMEKLQKRLFQPANGVRSTRLLVIIHNITQNQFFYLWRRVFSGNKTLNQCLSAKSKDTFCLVFPHFSFFFLFQLFDTKKHWKSRFHPAFGVPSTQRLIKIYNIASIK